MKVYTTIFNITKSVHRISHRTYSSLKLSPKSQTNMEKAYFRYSNGDEQYHLSFIYNDESKGKPQQINFSRRHDENVSVLISRINMKIEKFLTPKKKKNKKEPTEETAPLPQITSELIQDGEVVPEDYRCMDVFNSGAEIELRVVENRYRVLVNSPWITNMTLPTSILAGFLLYPLKFEGLFIDKEKSQFVWYVGEGKSHVSSQLNWQEVGRGFTHTTSTADVGKKIKLTCVPGNENGVGAEIEVVSANHVEAGPGHCPFETRHLFTRDELSGKEIRTVSYNILADLYCDSDFTRAELFPYCPAYALHIDYRKQLFLKEILGYNGDIVCLQEVDAKIFKSDLEPLLNANSYEGCFARKGGQVAEGEACFFRKNRFNLIEHRTCVLGEELKSPVFKSIWDLIKDNEPFVKRLEPRSTTVQGVVLQSVENENEIIVVGNTHFYFHPNADHVRITQGGLTILWLCDLVQHYKNIMPNKRVSLVLCGDFNSVPSCGVYQLYTTGFVPDSLEDWRSHEEESVQGVTINQPILLASACGTPEYTNFTVGFADCLDYIFYEKENFEVVQVVPLPSNEELKLHSAIPSIVFPSDHIALVADLKLK